MMNRTSTRIYIVVVAAIFSVLLMQAHAASPQPDPDPTSRVNAASELIKVRQFSDALEKYLDPVIAEFELAYGSRKGRVYCSGSEVETLLYLIQSAQRKEEAIAVGRAYAEAYFLKGYILVEMHDTDQAMGFIRKANSLSPSNPQFLCELANIHQDRKEWTKALELYERAVDGAKLLDAKGTTFYLRRAMRGKGFVYVELGKFDESEKMYQECLKLDPGDKGAIDELKYVAQARALHAH